jgi:hypothetical protein
MYVCMYGCLLCMFVCMYMLYVCTAHTYMPAQELLGISMTSPFQFFLYLPDIPVSRVSFFSPSLPRQAETSFNIPYYG